MRIKNLLCFILLIISVGQIAIAENKKPEFMPVKAGEIAKFDGYLFSPEAITKIYTKTNEDIRLAKAESENKLILAQIDMQKLIDLNDSERRIQAKLLQDTILAKDEIIQNKLDVINKLERNRTIGNILIAGSFIAGSVLTFTLVYYTVGLVK